MNVERVLVGMDAEPASRLAVDWAIERARRRPARITLLTAFDRLADDPADLHHRLTATATRITSALPGTEVHTALVERSILHGLIDWSASHDLLVLGSHPRRPVATALAGSLPYRVAASAHCATVVVPDDWAAVDAPVLVGVGDDETANRAMLFAAREAVELGVELEVVHAWRMPSPAEPLTALAVEPTALRAAHREVLVAALERIRAAFPGVRCRGHLFEGTAGERLAPDRGAASLVVLGTHHHAPLAGMLVGSTAMAVLRGARVPVCIVPVGVPEAAAVDPVPAIPAPWDLRP